MNKRIIFSFCLVLLGAVSQLRAQMSCCQVMTMEDYQLLGAAQDFQRAHAEPIPFNFVSLAGGQMVTFNTPGTEGATANAFYIKAKKPSNKWLFVYQEWWGLNDHIKKQAETFYNDLGGAVNVLAMDMYDGKLATKTEDAGKFMSEAKESRLESIMKGASAFAGPKAKIASVGWCFGGGLSLRSALITNKKTVGCIMYYGMPVNEVEKLKTLKTDVLGIFAGREKWINTDIVSAFDKNMKAAGKKLTYKIFDAEHAFANPSNPFYDKAASEEAYTMSLTYLKQKFGLK